MLDPDRPALILAPMEGVTDAPMRAVMGESGAFTSAVSEFLRVSHSVLSPAVVRRHVPELLAGGRTPTGLPVQVQLLGGDPGRVAASAAVTHAAGAAAIDLNFGCPAPTVNRHDGGATLLKHPHRIRAIVAAVRAALPCSVPVSAKLRLGWDSVGPVDENAAMAAEGGASWITIHARTRTQGYAPPVYWDRIGRVRERLGIPVVANGDIRTLDDFRRCRDETGCRHFMIGRGALADPRLPRRVAAALGLMPPDPDAGRPIDWPAELRRLADRMSAAVAGRPDRVVHRLKQWLSLAARFGTFAGFDAVKRAATVGELFAGLVGRPPEPDGRRRPAEVPAADGCCTAGW
ncbi:MAG: tRNA-dihydrouridine synthase family protein [Gemmataceae bacterium]|nr:tRNA-dihydrouridine synthase family protein [Gemmataceae bacterium]